MKELALLRDIHTYPSPSFSRTSLNNIVYPKGIVVYDVNTLVNAMVSENSSSCCFTLQERKSI